MYESSFQNVRVEDVSSNYFNMCGVLEGQNGVRALRLDGLYHSAVRLMGGIPDPTQSPVFRYIRCLDLVRWYAPDSTSFLYLGLGAGVAPSRMLSIEPVASIQVVEIDPVVVQAATEQFGFDSDKIPVATQEAGQWLEVSEDKFDVIVVDVYLDDSMADHLLTEEFVLLLHDHLTDNGVVAVNLMGPLEGPNSARVRTTINAYYKIFGEGHLYPIYNGSNNFDLAASGLNTELFVAKSNLFEDLDSTSDRGGVKLDAALSRIIFDRYKKQL